MNAMTDGRVCLNVQDFDWMVSMDHNVYQYTNLFYCCLQLGVMQDLVRNLVSSPFLSYKCKNKKSDRNFTDKTLDIRLQVKSGHTKPSDLTCHLTNDVHVPLTGLIYEQN